MQQDPIDQMAKRTQRYWYEDGIWEIGFASLNLLLAGFYWLVNNYDWNGPRALVLMILQIGVILAAGWLVNRLVTFLKERITYPRTGYVAYRKPAPRSRVKRFALTAALAFGMAVLVGFIAAGSVVQNRVPLVTGILLAGMMVYLGYRFGLGRMYPLAVLVVLLGVVISLSGLPVSTSSMVFFAGFGLLFLLSGGLTLAAYLRRTQPAGEDELASGDPS